MRRGHLRCTRRAKERNIKSPTTHQVANVEPPMSLLQQTPLACEAHHLVSHSPIARREQCGERTSPPRPSRDTNLRQPLRPCLARRWRQRPPSSCGFRKANEESVRAHQQRSSSLVSLVRHGGFPRYKQEPIGPNSQGPAL